MAKLCGMADYYFSHIRKELGVTTGVIKGWIDEGKLVAGERPNTVTGESFESFLRSNGELYFNRYKAALIHSMKNHIAEVEAKEPTEQRLKIARLFKERLAEVEQEVYA